MPLSNWIWHKILKTNNAKRGLFSFIAFVLFIVLLVVVYTLILQRNFSGEILESGIARNQLRVESVFDLLSQKFSAEDFEKFRSESDMNDPRYVEIQKQLNEIRNFKGIRYLYTATKNEAGELIYVVDGLEKSTSDFRAPGSKIEPEMIPYIKRALSRRLV